MVFPACLVSGGPDTPKTTKADHGLGILPEECLRTAAALPVELGQVNHVILPKPVVNHELLVYPAVGRPGLPIASMKRGLNNRVQVFKLDRPWCLYAWKIGCGRHMFYPRNSPCLYARLRFLRCRTTLAI